MNRKLNKLNNSGFTLLETMIGFVLLGIILVAASQVIASSTEVYYQTKSVSYGLQASQAILTEIRGEIEDAQSFSLLKYNNSESKFEKKYSDKDVYVELSDRSEDYYKTIEFIAPNGDQIKFSFSESNGNLDFKKIINSAYTTRFLYGLFRQPTEKKYTSLEIGMGYTIKDIRFSLINKSADNLNICNCPVIKIELTIENEKWGEYSAVDYASLYNLYDQFTGVYTKD